MKRLRSSSSSDSSDNESPSTSFCSSNKYGSKPETPTTMPKKPAEVFRKDLISAMKLPDSHHVSPEDYYLLADTWRQEWEKGVQVPASPDTIPQPSLRIIAEKPKETLFSRQRKYIQCWNPEPTEPGYVNILELAEAMCRYDLDDMDLYWLQELNAELGEMGEAAVDELTMERVMEALERQCHDNMNHAIETEEGLGIEYDEDVICDVCRSPDSEEGNDMVFCDKCNICVHQACYGIVKVPDGNWLCRTCVLGIDPQCLLCPKKGGAMKATRAGTKWAHVSCALWIPEVSIACPERMEPITKVSHIPPSRWSLICSLCKLKTGACIQCSVKSCTIPFHVTCAFEHSLEMKTILDEGDEVKFKSYCLKHSKTKAGEPGLSPARHKAPSDTEKVGLRAQKLKELEEEFYALVRPEELAQALGLPQLVLDFVFQYWKLKRKSNFNKALLPPKEGEENLLLQPKEDSVHTRMRMFMHLRQDLERVRNLCYMVSRREKLKLSQSKAQEQIFNLQVQLINQELSAGLPLSYTLDSALFRPPPRITLKLKMPKVTLGNGKTSSKSGNGPLCPDTSGNVYERSVVGGGAVPTGKSQHYAGRVRKEDHANGLLATSGRSRAEAEGVAGGGPPLPAKPSGKPLALHAALHGRSANGGGGKLEAPQRARPPKSNGVMEKPLPQRDASCQLGPAAAADVGTLGGLRKPGVEHFGRSLKEATVCLVRTPEDLRGPDKPSRKGSGKERPWGKSAPERHAGKAPSYQENDGYCPDLELSDSEPEAKGKRRQARGPPGGGGGGSGKESPSRDYSRGGSRGKLALGSRASVQR
ncbi:protein Jade-3 [Anguilla anguilla]|uniref:protein Jade-3 n=1 Tax=Anguilla anguilla TaxID=7936 RepID=UPI0015B11043|nr:protein Jade-3 [Anguilla anguilla]XP_035265564.1 protein Jade-3 [Anguilla anguilla]